MASFPTAVRSSRKLAFSLNQARHISDLSITRTGKPILRVQGHTATVFGATGQLGRYIVNRLARQGCQVVIPFREDMAKRHLKVAGDLGRVAFIEYDLYNTESIEASVRHSDVVYNLIGRNYPTKNYSLEDVHVEGTERIVEAVAKYDVDRYIHVSSYNADPNSPSDFFATKGRGEQVARSIFPETTIVRPAPIFGFEDNLLIRLAGVTNLFTSNNMQERYWPVHSIDVGQALETMLYDDTTAGQTFELYGPKNYSTAEIAEMVDREIYKKRRHINVPRAILKPAAGLLNKVLWWPILSAEDVDREFIDQKIDESAKTFADLGINPGDISNYTYHYLQGYRSSAYYDLPPATEREKREDKKTLSSHALAALQDFYGERDAHADKFEKLKAAAEEQHSGQPLSMDAFVEDWNKSQFWYSEETATLLAKQLLDGVKEDEVIAVVSAPSAFVAMMNLLKIYLLEHDNRFGAFPEYIFWDFNDKFAKLPADLKGGVDRIICDPPFLSDECQTKAAMTVRWMLRPTSKQTTERRPRLILCTGERMETLIGKLYGPLGVRTTTYEPRHARGLSNEFYCYANFECDEWQFRG
ncbi:putative N6-adenine methyltransferase-domain-containing protein [Hypoxylon rubiginosum]|uniref:N6-adenine methyltransferase-domain-containing protein n=1 Tax=Hypoxylon rubiginosum TaxID=110542 RepID=A0ACC0CQX3_9PEZI|nr:putative N6-adenine methyltransferase-domain-containing protein [Hypoxylon rubiginosum]